MPAHAWLATERVVAPNGWVRSRVVAMRDQAPLLLRLVEASHPASATIAAKDCYHLNDLRVELAAGARLLLREQLVLGRHGERHGRLRQRMRVERNERALYHQELAIGDEGSGWDGAAVAHRYRALASLLVVDPDWVGAGPTTRRWATPPRCCASTVPQSY